MTEAKPFSARSYTLSGCTLRRLEDADAAPLAETLVQMDPWRRLNYSAERFRNYFTAADPALNRFVIEAQNKTAGVVCVRQPWLKGPYLELLGVWKPYQERGVGKEVMSWLEGEARKAAKNLWVLVSSFNEPARMFYAGVGFEEVATLPDLAEPGFQEMLLRKKL